MDEITLDLTLHYSSSLLSTSSFLPFSLSHSSSPSLRQGINRVATASRKFIHTRVFFAPPTIPAAHTFLSTSTAVEFIASRCCARLLETLFLVLNSEFLSLFRPCLTASTRQVIEPDHMQIEGSNGPNGSGGSAWGAAASLAAQAPKLRDGAHYATWRTDMEVWLERHGAQGVHTRVMTSDQWRDCAEKVEQAKEAELEAALQLVLGGGLSSNSSPLPLSLLAAKRRVTSQRNRESNPTLRVQR